MFAFKITLKLSAFLVAGSLVSVAPTMAASTNGMNRYQGTNGMNRYQGTNGTNRFGYGTPAGNGGDNNASSVADPHAGMYLDWNGIWQYKTDSGPAVTLPMWDLQY